MKKIIREFREFAMRGNVLDMAIGVVMGNAFGKIVSSLVNDIIMPLFGALLGDSMFENLRITLVPAVNNEGGVFLNYGVFIQTIVDFLIIAFSIFMAVKLINSFRRRNKKEEQPAEPELTKEEILLTEIRDLLKERTAEQEQ